MQDFGPYGYKSRTEEIRWSRLRRMPLQMILEDRDDGTEWMLSHNSTHIVLRTGRPPRQVSYVKFPPYSGPHLFLPRFERCVRLFVRDGHLGYEEILEHIDEEVWTRYGSDQAFKKLFVPITWLDDGHIAWTTEV